SPGASLFPEVPFTTLTPIPPASLAQTLSMAARDAGALPPGEWCRRLRRSWLTLYTAFATG
ncbi:MAG: hypothetical protein QXQ60_04155, partial [Thermofilum sp.]